MILAAGDFPLENVLDIAYNYYHTIATIIILPVRHLLWCPALRPSKFMSQRAHKVAKIEACRKAKTFARVWVRPHTCEGGAPP